MSWPYTQWYEPGPRRETDITVGGLPPDTHWMTSVGEDEQRRISQQYNPHGDPMEIAKNLALARKLGIKDFGYLGEAAKITSLYGSNWWSTWKGDLVALGLGMLLGFVGYSLWVKRESYGAGMGGGIGGWVVKVWDDDSDSYRSVMGGFDTQDEADEWIESMGIPDAYSDFSGGVARRHGGKYFPALRGSGSFAGGIKYGKEDR